MKRKLLFVAASLLLMAGGLLGLIFWCDGQVARSAQGKLYDEVSALPPHKVGLLLGTAKYLQNGRLNLYYQYRIQAAWELLKANKIQYLVISGDNSSFEYNEPEMMKQDLLALGAEENRLFLDYAGFRTFDSVLRLRDIFGQQEAVVISQAFHNERALYIASREGMTLVGYNAQDVGRRAGRKVQMRERLARVKVFWDYLSNTQPRYLGEAVPIP
jgi:SanA protein